MFPNPPNSTYTDPSVSDARCSATHNYHRVVLSLNNIRHVLGFFMCARRFLFFIFFIIQAGTRWYLLPWKTNHIHLLWIAIEALKRCAGGSAPTTDYRPSYDDAKVTQAMWRSTLYQYSTSKKWWVNPKTRHSQLQKTCLEIPTRIYKILF